MREQMRLLPTAKVTKDASGKLIWHGPEWGIAEFDDWTIFSYLEPGWEFEILDYDVMIYTSYVQRLDHGLFWWNRIVAACTKKGEEIYHAQCRLIVWLCDRGLGVRHEGMLPNWNCIFQPKK